jgi:hypothetical protein
MVPIFSNGDFALGASKATHRLLFCAYSRIPPALDADADVGALDPPPDCPPDDRAG